MFLSAFVNGETGARPWRNRKKKKETIRKRKRAAPENGSVVDEKQIKEGKFPFRTPFFGVFGRLSDFPHFPIVPPSRFNNFRSNHFLVSTRTKRWNHRFIASPRAEPISIPLLDLIEFFLSRFVRRLPFPRFRSAEGQVATKLVGHVWHAEIVAGVLEHKVHGPFCCPIRIGAHVDQFLFDFPGFDPLFQMAAAIGRRNGRPAARKTKGNETKTRHERVRTHGERESH